MHIIMNVPALENNSLTKNPDILNIAHLINKGCIGNEEIMLNNNMFGQFCSSSTTEITNIYIPYMIESWKPAIDDEEYRETLIYLPPLIEGDIFSDDLPFQVITAFALRSYTKKHRHILVPAFVSILYNANEH